LIRMIDLVKCETRGGKEKKKGKKKGKGKARKFLPRKYPAPSGSNSSPSEPVLRSFRFRFEEAAKERKKEGGGEKKKKGEKKGEKKPFLKLENHVQFFAFYMMSIAPSTLPHNG